jgi:hypothetical protein
MPEEKKQNISITIADLKPIPLQIKLEDEIVYRDAEKLVNGLWKKWMQVFKDSCSSNEVMARVAFQFARLYVEQRNANVKVEEFMAEFEKKLDEMVIKL